MTGEVVTEMITSGDDVKHYIYVSSYFNDQHKNRLDEIVYSTQFRSLFEAFKKDKISFNEFKKRVINFASKLGIEVVGLSDEKEL